jgi:TolB-like protein
MPDIFLSYSRQDVAVADAMAAVLAAAGHDVWWDREIRAGDVYDQVLENALRASRLVIVLWSKTAVVSDWVRSEATVAMQSGTLMPVMIEDCQRPVAFELRQSADLIGWKGNEKDPRLAAVLAEVARQLGAPAAVARPAVVPAGPSRRLLIGGAAGVAALAAGGFGAWQAFGGKADDGTASVVVLPFANLSGDPEQAFFSDGIAEELRNALSQISGLKVIGRVTSEQFRDSKDLSAAAEKLGVDHVLTGSVRRSPTTIRIGAQLVDGRTGVESWSQSYDQPIGDSLAIQSKIATSVVAALSAKLAKAAGTIVVGGTSNPQAQEQFLKGRELVTFVDPSEANTRLAIALFEAANALDPNYAYAWAGRGFQYGNLARYSTSATDRAVWQGKALAAAQRAIALAPNSGFVRASLAYRYLAKLDLRRAVAEAERAVALSPDDANALANSARVLLNADPDRAVTLTRKAVDLDPFNAFYLASYALALCFARRFGDGAEAARQAMALSENKVGASALFLSQLALGKSDVMRPTLQSNPDESMRLAMAAIVAARAGNRAAADATLATLRSSDFESREYGLALVHAQAGETEAALTALEAALQRKESDLFAVAVDPFLDPIRNEPRFKAVQDAVIPPDLLVPPKRRPA